MKGQKINDRYQIIKTIGEGGMANVYLAYDTILDRNVAVKVLRGDLSNDEKFLRRFQREALSASSLSHPNIVEVYDVGEENGQYYIIMEYVEGHHLKEILKKRGKLTVPEVVDYMLQITEGIAHAHDSYIIHRDIKPQNIMVLDNGLIKITDFGIAMAMNSTQLTQTNSVMGTVHYLPPEQASGKGSTVRSDIYSMGILMYELLTGKLPFRGENAVEIALKHLKEPLPSIKKELPDLPQSIENIVLKSTAKNPKNRYESARQMHDDLATCLDENRINEPKVVYQYKEGEPEVSKNKETKENKVDQNIDEEIMRKITEHDMKKQNKTILVLASVFTALILITTILVFLVPRLSKKDNIIVPDVTGLSVGEAEQKLLDVGFTLIDDTVKLSSETVEAGLVIRTDPKAGRTVKEGKEITIYESTGKETITLDNYQTLTYKSVQKDLEALNLVVVIETEAVDDPSLYKAGEIVNQSPKAGTVLNSGDTVTLFIVEKLTEYPDFVLENYTLDDVRAFALEYNLVLKVEDESTDDYPEGTICYQSRTAGQKIISGASLVVKVAIPKGVVNPDDQTGGSSSGGDGSLD